MRVKTVGYRCVCVTDGTVKTKFGVFVKNCTCRWRGGGTCAPYTHAALSFQHVADLYRSLHDNPTCYVRFVVAVGENTQLGPV